MEKATSSDSPMSDHGMSRQSAPVAHCAEIEGTMRELKPLAALKKTLVQVKIEIEHQGDDEDPISIKQEVWDTEYNESQQDNVHHSDMVMKREIFTEDIKYGDSNENNQPLSDIEIQGNENTKNATSTESEKKGNEGMSVWIKVEINEDEQIPADVEKKEGVPLSAPGVPNAQPLLPPLQQQRAEARRLIAEKQKYECELCNTRFTFRHSLNRHLKKFHTEQDPLSSDSVGVSGASDAKVTKLRKQLKCELCNKRLSQIKTLRSHIMTYHGPTFTCTVCSKPFYLESDFKQHCHDSAKPFACELCDKRFLLEVWLERHKVAVHDKPYACDICGKRFSKNCLLVRHKPVHSSDKMYTCDMCPKSFKQKASLVNHWPTHSADLQYHCDICKRRFCSKQSMKAHIKGHSLKKFKCEVCDKRFRIKSLLEYHKPVHYGDKPFACDSCGERFSEKIAWLSHTCRCSKKRFACDLCSKRFKRKVSMTEHMKNMHYKEKPFSCNVCGKNYTLEKHLARHSKTHNSIFIKTQVN